MHLFGLSVTDQFCSMLLQPSADKYFFYVDFVDMRKGFDSLSGIVSSSINHDPVSANVFIFINRRGTQLKLLQWEGDGFAVYYKRLERGTFERPLALANELFICIEVIELQKIFKGISSRSTRQRVRYQHKPVIC